MKARWLTDKYISLMLLVFPLWTGTEGYAAITRGKFLFFAVLSALYLALLLPCALLDGEKPRRARLPQWSALACMAAAWARAATTGC